MRRNFLRTLGSAAMGAGALAFGTAASSVLAACLGDESDGDSTTGERVTLSTRVELRNGASFTNALAWEFILTKVALSSGALYYFDGEPLEPVARGHRSRFPSLVSVAHAHPGHYKEGNARGEMLESASYDLAAGPATLAPGEGVTGLYRSARFTFQSPATGALAAELGDKVVIIEGTATKDGSTKAFRLVGTVEDVLNAAELPQVDGCTFEEVTVEGDGTVIVMVDPAVWLDQADPVDLPDSTMPAEVARDHAVHLAFSRGLKKATAYHFVFEA